MAQSSFRDRGVSAVRRVAPKAVDKVAQLRSARSEAGATASLAELTRRVADLEAEVQENRQLNLRLAELIDVVQELLLPLSQRDNDRVEEILERYAGSF